MIDELFTEKSPLADCFNSFEVRPGQLAMAEAVVQTISGESEGHGNILPRILVAEAETGVGKTLAYLIPAITSGQRVVVSTATLNLQDQIMDKEIPLIAQLFGKEIPAICIKGRPNYLCLYRWYQHLSISQDSLFEGSFIERISNWQLTTETGDRAELDWLGERSSLWPKISAHSNQCLGRDCPEAQSCYINSLRKKAGKATLLVVNHHLFFSDLALRQDGFGEVLPRYEGVIFDEAHHLENVASSFFGKSFSQYQLINLCQDIEQQAEADLDPQRLQTVIGATRGLKSRAEEFLHLFPSQRGRRHLHEVIKQLSHEQWEKEVTLLGSGLKRLSEELEDCIPYGDAWGGLGRRAQELHDALYSIALPDSLREVGAFVYWYERRERSVSLSATPVEVAAHLQNTLYTSVDWCVMTSATLSSGGDFDYMKTRLGLDEDTRFLRFHSPFDYPGRTQMYIPESTFPEPSRGDYQLEACKAACRLLEISSGRGLVLCTSFKGMDQMSEYLNEYLEYPVLTQGQASRNALLQTFRETPQSVLVAVASFWEGVDVQGDALSIVIIDKLPFEVPTDPVVQARVAAITQDGGNPFFSFQVPRAILTLRQGVGRLMRSSEDKGVIAILDVRLFTKGYGKLFFKSLPASPLVRKLEQVSQFFNQVSR